ncbi:HipA domain-containing protein [Burkholderia cenocepacia]|uniref:HipA domain-containing protein n=1 Tax=Burkholderia cenocepacia TaxID=95486 RepID=UPI001CF3AA30|nr:HipA domain-containing protein [Burkholderia cenocepacia]MCA8236140.1 HipA domain-containing protein [Burkholderia cenocepacia]
MIESIEPRNQRQIIDVVHWRTDEEFGVFPQGARAKEAVFTPQDSGDEPLLPCHRYLFKRSKQAYPDQFWGEIVAYRIGCAMGLSVPPAFAAYNSGTGYSAALIEWFYVHPERFVHAGDYFQRLIPEFDRDRGREHNLADAKRLMRAFAQTQMLRDDWRQWLADMFMFDAVIGNTDRHQDNWGFIFSNPGRARGMARIAPLFDNGTSLGHEMFPERINGWRDENFERYIGRGRHHMAVARADGCSSTQHATMVQNVITEWPETRLILRRRLQLLQVVLPNLLDSLMALGGSIPLSEGRARFLRRLLTDRIALLWGIVQ